MRLFAVVFGLSFILFGCGEDDPQTVDEACKNITCEAGVCAAGECVNPTFCDDSQTCIDGFVCDENKCNIEVVELCLDVECPAGECSKTTGECVNKSVCDRDTPTDCIDGFACYDQTCQDEATICAEVDCSRGVCDFTLAECVNPAICENDVQCLSGSFCNADNNCEENKCDLNGVDCPRGECNPRTGLCEDASICATLDDCSDGSYCVGTECTPIDEACVACTGNQVCTPNVNRVTCSESPDGCLNALDCMDARTCNQGVCGDPVACVPDANEPNDVGTPTVWVDVATQDSINGSLCQGDSDYFLYNTRDSPLFTGTLLVSLKVNPQNVGNGDFSIELLKNNVSIGTQNSNGASTVELRHPVTAVDVGEFVVKVTDSSLNVTGIEYELFINLVDMEADNACQNATPIVNGSASGDTTTSMSTSLEQSCAPAGVKRESIFTLEVLAKSEVTLAVAQLNSTISIRSSCGIDQSEISCSTATNELTTILDPGTYFVLVEAVDADGAFGVAAIQKPIVCTPGANRCVDADNGETCNAAGTGYDAFGCNGDGCDMGTGFCVRPAGDVCSIAIDATAGFDSTIDFGSLSGDYLSGVCGSTFASEGMDTTFMVDLPPNNRVDVNATHSSFTSLSVMIVNDCNNIDQTCLASDTGSTSDAGYVNSSAQNETVFIIVDSSSSFSGSADIKIETSPIICTPNSSVCVGNDIDLCDDRGTSSTITGCAYGCDPQTNTCNPALNDVCSAAFDVTAGGTFNGTLSDYTDDYEPDSCISFGAPGPDAVWSVNAVAGQILTASMTGGFDASLYVVSDCSDIAGTCGAGSDSGAVETINYAIPTTGTYYIITDAFLASASGTFSLTVDLVTPICTPGTKMCAGNNLETCRADGSGFDTEMCPGSCDTLANECSGNSCASPVVITTAGQYTGDTGLFTDEYDPSAASCVNRAPGNDVIYQINGTPGDVITATMTSSFDAVIYAVSDCSDLNTCVAGQDSGNPESITFVLPATGSMFVMADSYTTSANGAYTLDVTIQTPDCLNPGQPVQCLDAMTLEYCDAQGFLQTYACACSGAACAQPTGDVCADVVTVFDQTMVSSSYGDFTPTYNPVSCPNGISDLDGPDAVYAIDLAPNSILTVDLSSTVFGRSMYVTSDCSDANSCLRGAGTGSQDQLVYHTAQGGRHYVHIDTSSNTTTSAFTALFSVTNGVCQPGESICDPNTNQTTTCSADGSQITSIVDCIAGCATPNACGGPVTPNDTCASAYNITAPISFVEDLDRFTDAINPGSASCFGRTTAGEDVVYSVNLPANTVVDVTVDGSARHTVAIVSDCTMPGTTCLAQGEEFGETRAIYAASNGPENVFVIIDHATNPSNLMDVSFDLRPQECMLGTETCISGTTREYCNEFYELKTETCSFGCNAGVCEPPTNDLCGGAIDATAGGTFTEEISNYADDYNQNNAASSCTGFSTAGPEGVWSVNAVAGQVLTATMDAANFDAALYVSTDCMMIDDSCVEGSDSGSRATESISYTIPTDGVYYIVADAFTSSPTGTFTITIGLN